MNNKAMANLSRNWKTVARRLLFCSLVILSVNVIASASDLRIAFDQEKLEKEFIEKMTNSALVGAFTVEGKERPPSEERYEIKSVKKTHQNTWVLEARIKYGNKDLTIPITLNVFWAGDTPVISLTNLEIPVLGKFTARVMIYGDRYAGTWQHGKVGGLMYGRVEKIKTEEKQKN